MPRTYFIFGDIEGKLDALRVECTKCERRGRYNVGKLIAKHGRRGNMGLMARGLVRTGVRRNEFFLDLVVNPLEPLLGSLSAILQLITLNLQVFVLILCSAQLDRKLVRQAHSAFALFVRQIGCLLEQRKDRLSGMIQRITMIARRFFLGCKLQHLLGHVGLARTHDSLPSH